MKAVILAGGLGTRISEETHLKPKPMVEIGGKPILWHIMKIYSAYGINDFVICLGYKGYCIKEYFANYFLQNKEIINDSLKIYFERVLLISLKKYIVEGNFYEVLKRPILVDGISGSTGEKYTKGSKLKLFIKQFLKRLLLKL